MKNSKKLLFLGIAATLLFSCGGKTPASSEAPVSSEAATSAPASSEEATSTPVTSEDVCSIKTSWDDTSYVAEEGYVYCDLNCASDWENVNVYAWNANATLETACTQWPGAAMTKDETTGYYKFFLGEGVTDSNVIFNNGTAQTNDLVYSSDAPLCVFMGGVPCKYNWLDINHKEVAKEETVSIDMLSFVGTEGWDNGTAHLEMPTGTDDLTITASGTPVGSYGLNTGKFYCGEGYANWRIYQTESPTLTFTSTTKTILSIKITYESNKTGVLTNADGNVESETVVEVNASSYEFGVGNTSADVTNGQVRISAIEVVIK